MKNIIERYPVKYPVYFKYENKIFSIEPKILCKKYNCHKLIKIHKDEFKYIYKNKKLLTHFNIQDNGHRPKKNYLIVKIIKPGYLSKKINKPPILDLRETYLAKCFYSKSYVSYNQLKDEIFKHSMNNIKSVKDLKKIILKRYRFSLADISSSKKISLGVAITKLQLIKRFKEIKLF